MADTAPLWLVIATLAVYSGFLIGFGEEIVDFDVGDCSGAVSCLTFAWDAISAFFSLVTLGGFSSPLPELIQLPLLLFFGIAWGSTIYNMVVATYSAVVPG